jgi:hypothetical protein
MITRSALRLLAAALLLRAASASAVTITVNSAADPAGFNAGITIAQLGTTITLRDAVDAVSNTGDTHTITFAPSLAGSTINLSGDPYGRSALLVGRAFASCNMTIQGATGNAGITIAANGAMRIFTTRGGGLGRADD